MYILIQECELGIEEWKAKVKVDKLSINNCKALIRQVKSLQSNKF